MVQALGGTGGLKVGADFLRRVDSGRAGMAQRSELGKSPRAFENAGFSVQSYPYYDAATHGIDFDGMLGTLERLPAGPSSCCTPAATTRPGWT